MAWAWDCCSECLWVCLQCLRTAAVWPGSSLLLWQPVQWIPGRLCVPRNGQSCQALLNRTNASECWCSVLCTYYALRESEGVTCLTRVCLQALWLGGLLQKYQCSCLELPWDLWIISLLGEYPNGSINNQESYSQVFTKLCSAYREIGKGFLLFSLAARSSSSSSCVCQCSDILLQLDVVKISWVSELLVQILDHLLVVSLLYSYLFLFLGWLVSPVSLVNLSSVVRQMRSFRGNGTWQLPWARKGDFRNIMCSEKLKPREHRIDSKLWNWSLDEVVFWVGFRIFSFRIFIFTSLC